MWSSPNEAPEPVARRPTPRPRPSVARAWLARVRDDLRSPARPVRPPPPTDVPTMHVWPVPLEPTRAGYRDAARVEGGGVRIVISRGLDRRAARAHRAGEIAFALSIAVGAIAIVVSMLPDAVHFPLCALILTVVGGGIHGVLPGVRRAIALVHRGLLTRTGLADLDPREPQRTVIECRDGEDLVVKRTPSRAHGALPRIVLPARALGGVRVVAARRCAHVVCDCGGHEIVLVRDLAESDAALLVARLRQLAPMATTPTSALAP